MVVRRTPDGLTTDVTPPPFNARTRVHEYGGGAFAVSAGNVYFSNFDDQRVYCQDPGAQPRPSEWSPGGILYFVSDRNGWWNLHRWRDGQVEPLCEMEAEFGVP